MVEFDRDLELPPGYRVGPLGELRSLPWPDDLSGLPPSLAPQIFAWARGERTATTPAVDGPRLQHHLWDQPWEWTLDQRRFMHLWFAVRPGDERGRWLWRSGVFRRAKGAGKDPFFGTLMILSAVGPVEFAGWAQDGTPIGRPRKKALVQVGANSEAQAGDVLSVLNDLVSPHLADEVGYDPGIQRTYIGNAKIELLTSSESSSEGDPASDIFLNETHHMTGANGGQRLGGVARRNAGKSPHGAARILEATNAHMPGGGSVGEDSYEAWQLQAGGHTRRKDILYDSLEADPRLRLHVEEELELGIAQAYAGSPWVDQERIRDEAQDPRVPVADSIRFYFNGLPTNELAWVEPRNFDRSGVLRVVEDGAPVAMFLDCSKSEDATALRLVRIDDDYSFGPDRWLWQRPHGDRGKGWLAPREEVDAVVASVFDRYAVQWFGVDPSPAKDDETEALYWAEQLDEWERRYRKRVAVWATPSGKHKSPIRFDMRLSVEGGRERNQAFTEMAMLVQGRIDADLGPGDELLFVHDADPLLRAHVMNARRRPNQWGITLGKATRDSKQLVDGAVAMVGAHLGARIVRQSGKPLRRVRRADRQRSSMVVHR